MQVLFPCSVEVFCLLQAYPAGNLKNKCAYVVVVDLSVTHGKTAVLSFPNPLVPLRRHATVSTSICQECVPQVHINGAKNMPGLNLPIPK